MVILIPQILAGAAFLGGKLLSNRSKNKQHRAQQEYLRQQHQMAEDARLARTNFLLAALGGRGLSDVLPGELRTRLATRRPFVPVPSGESFLGDVLSGVAPYIGGNPFSALGSGSPTGATPSTNNPVVALPGGGRAQIATLPPGALRS